MTATMEAPKKLKPISPTTYDGVLFQAVESGKRPSDDELAALLADAVQTVEQFNADYETLRQRYEWKEQREELPLLQVQAETIVEASDKIRDKKDGLRKTLRKKVAELVKSCDAKCDDIDAEATQYEAEQGLPEMHRKLVLFGDAERQLMDGCPAELREEYKELKAKPLEPADAGIRREAYHRRIEGVVGTELSVDGESFITGPHGKRFWEEALRQGGAQWADQATYNLKEIATAERELAALEAECEAVQTERPKQLAALHARVLDWKSATLTS
jgi:hypothetical protein